MRYYTPEEIRGSEKESVTSALKNYSGRNLQDGFAANVVARYHDLCSTQKRDQVRVLDYGIASGAFARQLYERGFTDVYGLDIDGYLSEENKKIVKEFKICDLGVDKIPWPDDYFDIVTAWCVLPHLENPHHCFRETKRILKPGGLFILSIPHIASKASIKYFLKFKDLARYLVSTNHITVFTPGVFSNTALKNFKPMAMEYLMDERIFRGAKGWLRRIIYKICLRNRYLKERIEELWGYNQIWILRKAD